MPSGPNMGYNFVFLSSDLNEGTHNYKATSYTLSHPGNPGRPANILKAEVIVCMLDISGKKKESCGPLNYCTARVKVFGGPP